MRKILAGIASALLVAGFALAADQTMTGQISDSMCGRSHKAAVEHGGANAKMSDADCVKACIGKGAKYVFVSGGKVYEIANQDFASLADHAGHTVKLTGAVSGNAVTVSSIEMPGKKS
jgi:hypothetical protein